MTIQPVHLVSNFEREVLHFLNHELIDNTLLCDQPWCRTMGECLARIHGFDVVTRLWGINTVMKCDKGQTYGCDIEEKIGMRLVDPKLVQSAQLRYVC